MTDFQFKAILSMVHDMMEECETAEDYEKVKKKIARKISGDLTPQEDKNEP